MNGRRNDIYYFTEAQLREHLATAVAILDDAQLEPLEHEALLIAVFEKVCGKNVVVEQLAMAPGALAIPRGV